jgi:hypothetical protein
VDVVVHVVDASVCLRADWGDFFFFIVVRVDWLRTLGLCCLRNGGRETRMRLFHDIVVDHGHLGLCWASKSLDCVVLVVDDCGCLKGSLLYRLVHGHIWDQRSRLDEWRRGHVLERLSRGNILGLRFLGRVRNEIMLVFCVVLVVFGIINGR